MLPFIGITLVLLRIRSCNRQEERDTKHIALKGEPIFGVRQKGHSLTRVRILPIQSQTELNTEVNTTHFMPENLNLAESQVVFLWTGLLAVFRMWHYHRGC